MKNLLFLFITVLLSTCSFAQKNQEKSVPAVVGTAFENQFKNAEDVEWEKEGNNYEVEFEIGEVEQSVLYDATGNLLETEIEIKVSELPNGVAEYVKSNYKGKIKEASKITDAIGTETYEVEVKRNDIIFDANGKYIKTIKK